MGGEQKEGQRGQESPGEGRGEEGRGGEGEGGWREKGRQDETRADKTRQDERRREPSELSSTGNLTTRTDTFLHARLTDPGNLPLEAVMTLLLTRALREPRLNRLASPSGLRGTLEVLGRRALLGTSSRQTPPCPTSK